MNKYALVFSLACLIGCFSTDAASAQTEIEAQNGAQPVRLSGRVNVLWGDPPPGSGRPKIVILLADDDGSATELLLSEELLSDLGGAMGLNGKRVTIAGVPAAMPESGVLVDAIEVVQGEVEEGAGGSTRSSNFHVWGSQPWVTILCRFSDSTGTTPETPTWFRTLMGAGYPGMDHYWRRNSHYYMDLTGSVVVGWYNLPQPRSYYVQDNDGDGIAETLKFDRALNDCAAAADDDVDFTNFMGINLMFNQTLDCVPNPPGSPSCFAWGGSRTRSLDGQSRTYALTWMPPWGYRKHSTLGQEMGHGFGLPHSHGWYGEEYDSQWDIMSQGGACMSPHAEYGCIGVDTIAHHKKMLGWIPFARRFECRVGDPIARTLTIERLALPPDNGNFLIASIGLPAILGLPWYSVESRKFWGYDAEIPGEGVVIHIITSRGADALVVDQDRNGNPNDAGAIWVPGEGFLDTNNGVLVFVESETDTGFVVSITTSPRDPTYADWGNTGDEDGSSANPWNTINEGMAGVIPGGTIFGAPGNYPGGVTLRKPLTLQRWGSSGSVVIGG